MRVENVNETTGIKVTEESRPGFTSLEVTNAPPKAPGIVYVTAKDGRKFGLKKLKPSQRFLLAKKIETPNLSTLMQVMAVASVFTIDDEAYEPPTSEAEVLKQLDLIGDDGLEAITEPVMTMYGTQMAPGDVDTAKN